MSTRLLPLFILLFHSLLTHAQQGFFLEGGSQKNATLPAFVDKPKPQASATVTVGVDFSGEGIPVSKYVYGNNANPYMTQMVDQPVLLNHIKELAPNVIRFPGGNLSSVYFWNSPKNNPPADAPAMILDGSGKSVNPGYWYGTNTESWTLSLDNYYAMLETTANTGMITVNYGYARYGLAQDPVAAAAHLAAEWVRYDNGRTKFWEVGNESNGNWQAGYRIKTADNKDGQPEIVTGELYGKHFKVFADSMRKAATEIGAEIYIGAQLLQEAPASWWNNTDRYWNAGVFAQAGNLPDYYIIHSYYTPYNTNSNAADILTSATKVTREMIEYVNTSIENAGLEPKPVALTEWNIFAVGSKQMISYVNGMHSAIVLAELIKNGYGMASRWDLANGYDNGNDHGTFSQGDEPGIPRWNPRPSFFYMYYFQKYFGDTMFPATVSGSADVLAYGSSFTSGESSVVLVNTSKTEKVTDVEIFSRGVGARYYYYTLTGGSDNGEFSLKVFVNGTGPALTAGGPGSYKTLSAHSATTEGGIRLSLPPRSIVYLLVDDGDNVVTSVPEKESARLAIMPNPAPGRFMLKLPVQTSFSLEMMDSFGRTVFGKENVSAAGSLEVMPDLPRGIYMLRVRTESEVYMERVVLE